MQASDVTAVLSLDQAVKTSPWTEAGFLSELANDHANPYVLTAAGELCGYIVYWLVADELTIHTIVTASAWRGRGLGELLLLQALSHSHAANMTIGSLEVRVSNEIAQTLYRKYEFKVVGRRPRYYRDNQEDALIMLAQGLDTPAYGRLLAEWQETLLNRLRETDHGRV
jgi:ribosomal-protein-alanine N-acetyltransferase